MLKIIFILFIIFQSPNEAFSQLPFAIKEFIRFETKGNLASKKSKAKIPIMHFEIPIKFLQEHFSGPQPLLYEMIFKKNGVEYIRWPIHPDDSIWYLELKQYLEKNQIDSTLHHYFNGYYTASRSLIIVPKKSQIFSLKVSTNHTGGDWNNKKLNVQDVIEARSMSTYFNNLEGRYFKIMDEPIGYSIAGIDQGLLIRKWPSNDHIYLPGFSALHTEIGSEIALLNGIKNIDEVAEFWKKNYVIPLAQGLAEFFLMTGAFPDSPHSQNFLIELDMHYKPTGKIIIRDIGDMHLISNFKKNNFLISKWPLDQIQTNSLKVTIGLLFGNSPPDWLNFKTYYEDYLPSFFSAFEDIITHQTGVPKEELQSTPMEGLRPKYTYSSKKYDLTSPQWQNFFESNACHEKLKALLTSTP